MRLPKKVLILGSGALKIGEAGEFDYSGSQAIKALKEEGVEVVLINPNIATNQTSKGLADQVYFLPITPVFVEKVIAKEKPDGLLLSFGGQTALNCGVALKNLGILDKYDVRVYGTPVSSIEKTEDRELFNKELQKIDVKVPRSIACTSASAAMKAGEKIGFPLLVRAAFALGGKGSGFANNEKELKELVDTAFAFSPQVLVEESLKGWKEIEYEVVRDSNDNCITVCNMENFDPLGIHTGESIVIAPSQTLSNSEYHMLRELALKVIRHLGIVGECNIQYALDPQSEEYRVIEVNARLSRSSALASKATGYPLAYVAAKLALGYSLPELRNAITGVTTACFEPALDYVALKIPRWDLDKFRKVSHHISSEMKSVGEIMALGRSFEEVIQKGLRMLQIGMIGLTGNERLNIDTENLRAAISKPTPKRILAIAEALRQGWDVMEIYKLSGVDPWFLGKLKRIVDMDAQLEKEELDEDLLRSAKKLGFSDKQIGLTRNCEEMEVRKLRKKFKVLPAVKQIDTMAAEYPAKTNYLYLTYHGDKHDVGFAPSKTSKKEPKKKAIVLGSGAYCIGSSVEFDWCSINAVKTLQANGYETMMINYNPETVSTDYDMCDRLYFDELSLERVLDIYELEDPEGVVVSTGGQIPNNLVNKLDSAGVNIFGTSGRSIDQAENRHKFSQLLDRLDVDQPKWKEFAKTEDAFKFADAVGYPVLVRPSYVLSGAAMAVAQNEEGLCAYLDKAARISKEAPVVITKFELGAKEIEIDAVAQNGELLIYAIGEHVENAGVHSGDATIVLPPQKLYLETIKRVRLIAKKIAEALKISGPFNIQFLAVNNDIKVIECNLRSSRSFPFSSKVTGYNFIEVATEAMLGKAKKRDYKTLDLDYVGVKAPQFSFSRLKGADPVLGVEMASTGEVACFGDDLNEAFLKAMLSTGFEIPKPESAVLISIGSIEGKADFLSAARKLVARGHPLYATPGTAKVFEENEVPVTVVHKIDSGLSPNCEELIKKDKISWVINIPRGYSHEDATLGYQIRRLTIDNNISLTIDLKVAKLMVDSIERYSIDDLAIEPWSHYLE
ncbi:carbamoyl-phosphate synthase (glutamine-hydrolyzing) large subunit [Candidatus Peregrinibacteria bacterium]|nr:MAG: carbamoyl-phosphate synthase (glutamine-hydrolyzing) large subunit [Candidatus Peregrinibacteria bacterium]